MEEDMGWAGRREEEQEMRLQRETGPGHDGFVARWRNEE